MSRAIGFAMVLLCLAVSVRAADIDDLVNKLKDKDTDVRRAAAQELIKAGPTAKDAAPALILALKDSDAFVRRYSAQALGAIGGDSSTIVPALGSLLKDGKERKEAQVAAVASLSKMGPAAVATLGGVLRDPNLDTTVRLKIIGALGTLGAESRPVLSTVLDEYLGKNVPKGRASLQQEEKREEKMALLEVLEKTLKAEDKAAIATLAEAAINKNLPNGRGNLEAMEKVAILNILESIATAEDKPVIVTFSDALAGRGIPKGGNALPPGDRRMLLGVLKKIATAEDKPYVTALEAVAADEKMKDADQLKKDEKELLKKVMEKK
jgi:hypothetical protein